MKPVDLATSRLVLDQPRTADCAIITEYCQDPVFEHTMTIPWPYQPSDAGFFVHDYAPRGWATDAEYTWAVRLDGEFLGVLGYRFNRSDIGYWLGSPHRGKGVMPEAVTAVADWLFGIGVGKLVWECVVGNAASAAVARKTGFAYLGEAPTQIPFRDGSHPPAWHGALGSTDTRDAKPGWPA